MHLQVQCHVGGDGGLIHDLFTKIYVLRSLTLISFR